MSDSQPNETIEYDVPDDLSGLGEAQEPEQYRTLLEIWRAVLEPSITGEMRNDPIAPQWAVKMVTMYPCVGFADSQVIPMRGVDNILIAEFRIASLDDTYNVW